MVEVAKVIIALEVVVVDEDREVEDIAVVVAASHDSPMATAIQSKKTCRSSKVL